MSNYLGTDLLSRNGKQQLEGNIHTLQKEHIQRKLR